MTDVNSESYAIKSDLARQVYEDLGENVYLCYQCVKCSSGCPVSQFFDWQPNQIMRAVQLGQEDIALESETPWLCAACQTCSTRCPQGLDINAIMEYLARTSLDRGIKPAVPEVNIFNEAFMREIRLWGRAYELGLMAEIKLRTGDLFSDIDLALKMVQKSKLAFIPEPTRPPRNVKPVAGAAQSIAYYPGCSLHSTASEFNTSTKSVCSALDMQLIEPKGWICCGSSAAHRADPEAGTRFPVENLAIIEKSGFSEVTMPCAACFNRHKAAQYEIHKHPERKAAVDDAIGYDYKDTVQVTTLIDAILDHAGAEKVASLVSGDLSKLNAVCYYGCLLTRPPEVTGAESPENPEEMDRLMQALGINVIDWSYKTSCCGASHSLTRPDIVFELSSNLIRHAQEAGADVIIVACPLCHTNLDARQFQMDLESPTPVLYFTQLMALAFGLPESSAALKKNLVDPYPVLRQRSVL